jgi:arsenate reductase
VRPFLKVKPVYSIKYGADAHPIIGFSKTYDDSFNPQSAFAAILTCTSGWRLPFYAGAEKNPITFEDPKHLIIHPNKKKNMRKSVQIATELFYVFSKIKK